MTHTSWVTFTFLSVMPCLRGSSSRAGHQEYPLTFATSSTGGWLILRDLGAPLLPEGLPEQSSTDKETKDNSVEVASHRRLESLNQLTQQLVGQKRQSIQMSLPTSLPKIQKTNVMAAPSKFQKTENI